MGRDLVQTYRLRALREQFGFSRSAQAHMIGVSPTALRDWEEGVPLSRASAQRVSKWHLSVDTVGVDEEVAESIRNGELLHVTVASQQLAMSYGTITEKCRSGLLRCVDLGPLGLYIHRDELLVTT